MCKMVNRLLERLAQEAGHQIHTHSDFGPQAGYGTKAQKGVIYRTSDYDAIKDRLSKDFFIDRELATGEFYPSLEPYVPYTLVSDMEHTRIGKQALMCDFHPIRIDKEIPVRIEKKGLFRKKVKTIREMRKYALPASEVVNSTKSESACGVFWHVCNTGNPEIASDSRTRAGGAQTEYIVIAAESDARALWELAQQNPDVVLQLGRMVFPGTLETILKETPLDRIQIINDEATAKNLNFEPMRSYRCNFRYS